MEGMSEHCGKGETYCYAGEIDRADNDIFCCGDKIARWDFRFEKMQRESNKNGGSYEMGIYVNCWRCMSISNPIEMCW
jgi:hypothetical protein